MFQSNVITDDYEVLQNEYLPTLILTLESEIIHLNEQAIEYLGNYYWEGQYLEMDEPSYKKWSHLVTTLKKTKYPMVSDLNVILQNGIYYHLTVEAKIDELTQHIIVHILFCNELALKELSQVNEEQEAVELSYRHIMQYVSKGIIITNHCGKIVDINNCALILLNQKRVELIQQPYSVLFENLEECGVSVEEYESNIKQYGHASCTVACQMVNQKMMYLQFESVMDQSCQYVVTTLSDVTKIRLMQSKLEQHDSLNVIGQMAASIAHEIRNPMTSLLGFTALLKENATEEASNYLSVIESELHRIEHILSEMLILSKPRQKKIVDVDVAMLLQDVVNVMLPHATMNNCVIQFMNFAKQVVTMKGCLVSLKQVIMNLVKNALESMPNGGTITIELDVNREGYAEIIVTDQGIGMTADCLEKLYQPFQTTKQQGTGLGLPFVKATVEEHQGQIHVQSDIGIGTIFMLQFPISHSFSIQKYTTNSIVIESDCLHF